MKYYKVRYGWNELEGETAAEREEIVHVLNEIPEWSPEENVADVLRAFDLTHDWLEVVEELYEFILEYNDIDDKRKVRTVPIYAKSLEAAWEQVDMICFHLEMDGLLERDSEVFVNEPGLRSINN